jgi:S-formylglutathione hydrolase FrmB
MLHTLPLLFAIAVTPETPPAPLEVRLAYPASTGVKTFTGRVFVIVSRKPIGDAPFAQSWFDPQPFFAQDVKDWPADTPLDFRPAVGFPKPWNELAAGDYHVQAIADRDLGDRDPLTGAGNLFSKPQKVTLDPKKPASLALALERVAPEKKFNEKPRVKRFEVESRLLSDFHGRPMKLQAGVILPKSFADAPERKYPFVYEIPGFSGDVHYVFRVEPRNPTDIAGTEVVYVVLDPSCRRGHHVFADSANNGPVGRALVEEFIPAIEKTYRGLGVASGRLVTGHSSGGWSSLWLQMTYPDVFGGVWSTAPDSVDFRDFQLVDLYRQEANLFSDEKGQPRPLARMNGKVAFTTRRFSDMEVVFGRGGQLFSFDAVFSPRTKTGEPAPLWDRRTGAVDPHVAVAWRKYDIRLVLEKNWPTLAPKLAGKLHVYMGAEDTFYLDGATRLLADSLKRLGSDAVIEIFPGRHHGNLIDAKLRKRIDGEMAKTLGGEGR